MAVRSKVLFRIALFLALAGCQPAVEESDRGVGTPPAQAGPDTDGGCANAQECDFHNPCSKDSCVNGNCRHSLVAGCCNHDRDCNDGDPCTADNCLNHLCTNSPV